MPGPTLLATTLGGGACSYTVAYPQADPSWPVANFALHAGTVAAAVAAAAFVAEVPTELLAASLCALCTIWLLSRRFRVSAESLVVIEGVGLQFCTRCANGHETTRFIEMAAVSAIILAEAVRFDRCYFYLACLLHGGDHDAHAPGGAPRLVVPFRHLLPSLHDLQRVRHEVEAVIQQGAGAAVGPDPMGGRTRRPVTGQRAPPLAQP